MLTGNVYVFQIINYNLQIANSMFTHPRTKFVNTSVGGATFEKEAVREWFQDFEVAVFSQWVRNE